MSEQVEAHVIKRYELVKKIGSGAYGIVWKVTDRKTGETLALKKIFDAFQHSTDAQRTYREIILLQEIDHPNVVKLRQVLRAENDKDLYLVFQFMEADLHNAIGQKILKDAHNRFILYQLAKAIKFLHSAEVIHRDLKPSNLLLNSDCTMKVCDFGLARSLIADRLVHDIILTEEVATRWYRAPEVLLGSHSYGKSADIWSMGCILAEILIGKPLFPGSSTLSQIEKIILFTGKPSKQEIESLHAQNAETMIEQVGPVKSRPFSEWFKAGTPKEAIDLVVKMLQFNPAKRPSAAQVLKSPYLSSFSNPREEYDSKKIIKPPISDNTKLGLKDYRSFIYQHIRRCYRDPRENSSIQEPSSHNSFHGDSKKHERPSTANKGQKPEYGHYFYRNSSNNSKNQKPRTSETKSTAVFGSKTNTSVYSSLEEQQRMKKKSSLKQMLRNKKTLLSSKGVFGGDGSKVLVKKPVRQYEFCGSTKQNRTYFGKPL